MRKMFMLAMVLAALAVMAFGAAGTGAWFTDSDTSADVTITSGELHLVLSGELANPVSIGDLFPGDQETTGHLLAIRNNDPAPLGDAPPAKYRMSDVKVSTTDATFYNKLTVTVTTYFPPVDCSSVAAGDTVYSGPLKDLYVESYDTGTATTTTGFVSGILQPNDTHEFCFFFGLDSSAGNGTQN